VSMVLHGELSCCSHKKQRAFSYLCCSEAVHCSPFRDRNVAMDRSGEPTCGIVGGINSGNKSKRDSSEPNPSHRRGTEKFELFFTFHGGASSHHGTAVFREEIDDATAPGFSLGTAICARVSKDGSLLLRPEYYMRRAAAADAGGPAGVEPPESRGLFKIFNPEFFKRTLYRIAIIQSGSFLQISDLVFYKRTPKPDRIRGVLQISRAAPEQQTEAGAATDDLCWPPAAMRPARDFVKICSPAPSHSSCSPRAPLRVQTPPETLPARRRRRNAARAAQGPLRV
jgi:hypothetical protein